MSIQYIENYDSDAVYQIFVLFNGKNKKIGEIQNNVFYDVDKKGNRVFPGTKFVNSKSFWSQFENIDIKKTSRPLAGFEPIIWGTYWVICGLITVGLVIVANGLHNQLFWILIFGINLIFTAKYRYNTGVVYFMTAVSIVVILVLYVAGKTNKGGNKI